ncbi:MAG: Fe-S cluster assembly protein SufD [Rhizobiales bacterium]|nr:Fe-S cluster assembly protein SufD [Hyphomicrobiales bacterium]
MTTAVARTAAEEAYGGALLPNPRLEDWKWTNLRTLIGRPFPPRRAVEARPAYVARLVAASPFAAIAATRLVFVNGRYDAAHSRLANGSVVATKLTGEPILDMNASFADDGAQLSLTGTTDLPVEMVFVATAGEARTIATRNVIEVAAGAAATVIETYLGEGDYLANSVGEYRVGRAARLDRVKAECEGPAALHLSHTQVTLADGANFRDFTLTSGARVSRQNGTCVFAGAGAEAKISGAYLLGGRQHADTRLVVDHAVPRCVSRELFKCVMDDQARGIFQGKVIVRPHAQKTDGKQSSHGLLLSETAEFDAKPELEIFADDVVCGHGATSGDLDHDQLFYLMSRGLPTAEAKSLLIAAFVGEAFDTIAHDGLREALGAFAAGWLTSHRRGN